ncbi:MAG: cyclic pyranopterin monophosphate synthase MoaC [Acidobacteriota bacterium]
MSDELTHVDSRGAARMVDVSEKHPSLREAEARGFVTVSEQGFVAIRDNNLSKGDVLSVARIAGIQAAKKTSEWIPLCHTVALDQIRVDLDLQAHSRRVSICAVAKAHGPTGVEMETLVAVSAAALALYDMIKAVDRSAWIGPIGVIRKSGGRSGSFHRAWPPNTRGESR